jgi:hypothetical protein
MESPTQGRNAKERREVIVLFRQLRRQPAIPFPQPRQRLKAPYARGVYLICDPGGRVVHVGRTPRAKNGLHQRLSDHLAGRSSFVHDHLQQDGSRLRAGYTFQYLEVEDTRKRALLEAFATAWLCPDHLGLADATEAEASGKTA